MLSPKRTKFRKQQKGKNRGLSYRAAQVDFGDFKRGAGSKRNGGAGLHDWAKGSKKNRQSRSVARADVRVALRVEEQRSPRRCCETSEKREFCIAVVGQTGNTRPGHCWPMHAGKS